MHELDSTGAVMAKVASTPGAIGYVSLDVIDDTVKLLTLNGVEANEENIKTGDYFLSRPFVMATNGEISAQNDLVKALFDYVYSAEGDELVKSVRPYSLQNSKKPQQLRRRTVTNIRPLQLRAGKLERRSFTLGAAAVVYSHPLLRRRNICTRKTFP